MNATRQVHKFGGSTLRGPQDLERLAHLVVKAYQPGFWLVVSAFAGVTEALRRQAWLAVEGHQERSWMDSFFALQTGSGRALDAGAETALVQNMSLLRAELEDRLRAVSLRNHLRPEDLDHILGFGERCAALRVESSLRAHGLPAEFVDPTRLGFVTDSTFGQAWPLAECARDIAAHASSYASRLPVVPGFVGKDAKRRWTTLGANGSDLTATFLGHALGAAQVVLWKDVPGVYQADPKLIPNAKVVPRLSYGEARALASLDGQILHVRTLQPALTRGEQVLILRGAAADHESDGTRIGEGSSSDTSALVLTWRPSLWLATWPSGIDLETASLEVLQETRTRTECEALFVARPEDVPKDALRTREVDLVAVVSDDFKRSSARVMQVLQRALDQTENLAWQRSPEGRALLFFTDPGQGMTLLRELHAQFAG